jgi:tRNA G10  N-methylase Trm11
MSSKSCGTDVFISGKNWRLSLAELVAYLEARKAKFEVCMFSREFFVVSLAENSEPVNISDLGGIIKIGTMSKSFPTALLTDAFLKENKQSKTRAREEIAISGVVTGMLEKAEGKYTFGISAYNSEENLHAVSKLIQRFAGSTIKQELRKHGVKAGFMGFSRDRKQPQLTHVEVLKKKMVENKAEALLCIGKQQTWLATTKAVHDPFQFQKRDVGKPRQRRIFAIPPRLARIMVNLSQCTAGKVLMDPFCGIGTILQEALLAKANVIGMDINQWCVESAKTNLEWLTTEYELKSAEFRVLRGDALNMARKIGQSVDCIASEPDLGPALHDVPTAAYALKIVEKLQPLFSGFLEEANKVLMNGGRLVLVTPYFKTRSGKPVRMPLDEKAKEVGFVRVPLFRKEFFAVDDAATQKLLETRSLWEIAERHKVGREIHVFQK